MRRRPPRGGRGLKLEWKKQHPAMERSPPTRGAWIETARSTSQPTANTVAPHAGGVD